LLRSPPSVSIGPTLCLHHHSSMSVTLSGPSRGLVSCNHSACPLISMCVSGCGNGTQCVRYELYSFHWMAGAARLRRSNHQLRFLRSIRHPFLLFRAHCRIVVPDFLLFPHIWFRTERAVLLLGFCLLSSDARTCSQASVHVCCPPACWRPTPYQPVADCNFQAWCSRSLLLVMVAVAQRRYAAGGALLAFAT